MSSLHYNHESLLTIYPGMSLSLLVLDVVASLLMGPLCPISWGVLTSRKVFPDVVHWNPTVQAWFGWQGTSGWT